MILMSNSRLITKIDTALPKEKKKRRKGNEGFLIHKDIYTGRRCKYVL